MLNEKDVLGEIECIFPNQVNEEMILKVNEKRKEISGLPWIVQKKT